MALPHLFKAGICKPVRVRLQEMCLGNLQLIDVQETQPIALIIADSISLDVQDTRTDVE
jgi:hypothetical protein